MVDEEGTILQSADDTTVRQAVTLRVARAVATARLTPADPGRGLPARLNQDSLWLPASTAATTIPGTRELGGPLQALRVHDSVRGTVLEIDRKISSEARCS